MQTGQSEPNITRSVPKTDSAWSAYRPIRSASQSSQTASVTSPDSFAVTLGSAASAATPDAHGSHSRRRDRRLGQVIQHEPHLGQRLRHLAGGVQLGRQHEQVVDESGRAHRGDAPAHVRAGQPHRVRLVLHLVPDADQPVAAGPGAQLVELFGDVPGGQVDPTHHTPDQAVAAGRRRQELLRLGALTHRLYQYRRRRPARR